MATALVLALLIGSGYWLTHPNRFAPVGSEFTLDVRVGEAAIVAVFAYPSKGSLLLREATPRRRAGGPDADVRLVYCIPSGGGPVGTAKGSAASVCKRILEPSGVLLQRPHDDNDKGYLLLEVMARDPGDVVIDGVRLEYRAGVRRGTESSGIIARIHVLPA